MEVGSLPQQNTSPAGFEPIGQLYSVIDSGLLSVLGWLALEVEMLANVLSEAGKLEYKEVPTPTAAAGEVVVAVRSALTCGTDLKAYLRGHPKWPMPTLFGHEFAGTIHQIGEGVDGRFEIGQEVMALPSAPCHDCFYCRKGLANLCRFAMDHFVMGAFAQYVRIPKHIVDEHLFPKPAQLPFAEAALWEPLSCVVYGLQQLPAEPGEQVVVLGAGPIALMFVMLLRRAGVSKIIVVGRRPFRLEVAKTLGADVVMRAEDNLKEQIPVATGGHGADKVYECTGVPEVWQQSIDYARMGGSILLYGGCSKDSSVTWPTYPIHYGQLTLKGAFHYTPTAAKQAYDLLCSGELPVSQLITDSFRPTELQAALEQFKQGDCVKLAMEPIW